MELPSLPLIQLTPSELSQLKEWLKAPGAQIFRRVLAAKYVDSSLALSHHVTEQANTADPLKNARRLLDDAYSYSRMFAVLEEFSRAAILNASPLIPK